MNHTLQHCNDSDWLLLFAAAETVKPNTPHKDLPKDAGEHTIQRLDQMRNSKGNLHTAEIRRNMQRIMQVSHHKHSVSPVLHLHAAQI